jgi:hypothetical protein
MPRRRTRLALLMAAAAAGLAPLALHAQAPAGPGTPPAPAARALPLWEAGVVAFGGTQPAYPGADRNVGGGLVLPFVVWRGPVLRVEDGGAGLRAVNTPSVQVDLGASGSFGARANEVPVRAGLPDLGTRVELGPRLRWRLGEAPFGGRFTADFPLRAVFDIDDGFTHVGTTFEPRLSWGRGLGEWGLGMSVAALIGDRRLAEGFYGVPAAFATPTRAAYEAKAGLVAWRLGANVSRRLAPDWRAFAFVRLDTVAGAANEASPLVQRTNGVAAGLGVSWTWRRGEAPGSD